LEIPLQPIKEIAEQAGYANVYAFTRAFTQTFKISPAAYRQQTRHSSAA
jgi:AraC-like DNA-binding protein